MGKVENRNSTTGNELRKPTTLRDVARAAGISPATASLALNGKTCIAPKTRELVLQTAQELGYEADFFAQGLRRRVSPQIGLFSLGLDLGAGMHLIQLIQNALQARGYDVPLHAYSLPAHDEAEHQASLMSSLCRQRPRAIVCHIANLSEASLHELRRYAEGGGPVVCFDTPAALECDQVEFDREHYTYLSARHLLELGHRELGLFLNGAKTVRDGANRVLLSGFQRALQEFDVPLREEWLWNGGRHLGVEIGGEELAHKFLALTHRPTGLCIVNDYAAMSFVSEVQRHGVRVPHDVSIVGHDDRPLAKHAAVPLCSVTYPVDEIAGHVVELLESRLNDRYDGPPRRETVRSELVIRQSATKPHRVVA
jgi:DNA-binding LacI/PurR family transcriptional regulator